MLTLTRKVMNFCSSIFHAVTGLGSARIYNQFLLFFVWTKYREKRLLSPMFWFQSDHWNLKHEKHGSGHSLFCCSAPCTAVATLKGAYSGFFRKKEQIPMASGTRYAMCIWKNSCSKRNTLYTHLKNWIFGLENKVIVEKQEDNF